MGETFSAQVHICNFSSSIIPDERLLSNPSEFIGYENGVQFSYPVQARRHDERIFQ